LGLASEAVEEIQLSNICLCAISLRTHSRKSHQTRPSTLSYHMPLGLDTSTASTTSEHHPQKTS
jgi:hypothetical protein